MNETGPPAAPSVQQTPERLNVASHAIIGVAMGLIAPFTGLAWIPAILTGMVIGRAGVEQRQGIRSSRSTQVLRILAVTGGVVAMLILGVIIGGLIAFLVAALAAFSERVAEGTRATDQTIARILITVVTIGVWALLVFVVNVNVNVRFGG
ncbi:MAG TPA: hypothetical protein VI277_09425 [Candidatus Limnocylindria bacterium]